MNSFNILDNILKLYSETIFKRSLGNVSKDGMIAPNFDFCMEGKPSLIILILCQTFLCEQIHQ